MTKRKREMNPRGRGGHLREEILQAATRLLAVSSRDTITLRAIAREAGIAAPSIYPHFADRDAVLNALIERTFKRLAEVCTDAAATTAPGAPCVRAVCAAYVTFARERPAEYRTLFERFPGNLTMVTNGAGERRPQVFQPGLTAFDALADALASAVADGSSASSDPILDAQALWSAIHGVLVLVPAMPGFPWRDLGTIIERLVTSLAHLR